MGTQLIIKAIEHVEEIQPALFEIVITLEEGSTLCLRMNAPTLQSLMAQIVLHTIA